MALDDPSKPLRSRLLKVPALRDKYLSYVRTIAEQSLSWSKLAPLVKQTRELLHDDIEADTKKLESLEAFETALSDKEPEAGPAQGRHESLRSFIEKRSKFLLEHPEVAKAKPVSFTRSVPTAKAEAPKPKVDAPKASATKADPTSSLVINEILAANKKSAKDPQGEFDDYIELFNPTDKAIDVSGMYVSDSAEALKKWKLPEGTKVAAGSYLVLWADGDDKATEGLHLNFKLSTTEKMCTWSIAMIGTMQSSIMYDSKSKPRMSPMVATREPPTNGSPWSLRPVKRIAKASSVLSFNLLSD